VVGVAVEVVDVVDVCVVVVVEAIVVEDPVCVLEVAVIVEPV